MNHEVHPELGRCTPSYIYFLNAQTPMTMTPSFHVMSSVSLVYIPKGIDTI